MKRVGIFGGTFDPPTIAHLLLARSVKEALDLDQIWFMPAGQPPEKPRATEANTRVLLLEAALQEEDKYVLNTMEVERRGPTDTVDTFEELTKKHADIEFYFIVGSDTFNGMHYWPGAARILELTKVVVLGRPLHHLDISELQALFTTDVKERIVVVSLPLIEISSTDIRERVKLGLSIKWLVPDSVIDQIERFKLYTEDKNG